MYYVLYYQNHLIGLTNKINFFLFFVGRIYLIWLSCPPVKMLNTIILPLRLRAHKVSLTRFCSVVVAFIKGD